MTSWMISKRTANRGIFMAMDLGRCHEGSIDIYCHIDAEDVMKSYMAYVPKQGI